MFWEVRLPGARVLAVAVPTAFGVLAALTVALPPRLSPSEVLAPAALVLWVVWLLWAYPSASCRNGEFDIRNPLRSVAFSASTGVAVHGTGVPRISVGTHSITPVVMLVSPGGVVDTMHASTGVSRGVNVVRIETLAPGHEERDGGAGTVLAAICERAGDRPVAFRQQWNVAGIALTLTLAAWVVMTLWGG